MYAHWNQNEPGFQQCWLWQFGPGPFKILDMGPVRDTPGILGWKGQAESAEINFQPGTWYTLRLPPTNQWASYGVTTATFYHTKWFQLVSPQ